MKSFQLTNDGIKFDRSDRGKPTLALEDAKNWHFNVSHAGNYAVFVAQSR